MARIAVGGWQHETNTFSPVLATYDAFAETDAWPGLCVGEELFAVTEGVHLPVTGAIESLKESGHELLPLVWCSATPSSYVTDDAFERISAMLLEQISTQMPMDGIYLDLHGAMVTQSFPDGEGEILRRVRQLVGDELPIAVSLDMHGNVTEKMVELSSVIDIFRTYPHIDMGETGSRTAKHLLSILETGQWYKSFGKCDFLIPLNWGCTWTEPTASIYAELPGIIGNDVFAAAIAVGFHLSDIEEVGPAVVAYGKSQSAADKAAEQILGWINDKEPDFAGEILSSQQAVTQAIEISANSSKPVILADTQDNPGGGGTGDTTGLLRELIDNKATQAVFGAMCDPETTAAAHQAGKGATIDIELGGKSGMPGHYPLKTQAKVVALGEGNFTATGPMYKGARMQLGQMALLEVQGVNIVVSSKNGQTADQSIFRHLGIEPVEQNIIALKSSVHFRNDFQHIAERIIVVASPGAVTADPNNLDYINVKRRY